MSDGLVGALIGAIAALAGTTLTFTLEWFRRNKERADDEADALRNQRATAYRNFVTQVHSAAHHMARAAEGTANTTERADAAALVNREVTGAILDLEILAPEETLRHANTLRDILREFRAIVEAGGGKAGDEWPMWEEILTRYRRERQAFQAEARGQILKDPGQPLKSY